MKGYLLLLLLPLVLSLSQLSYASYNVTHLNTTVMLNSTGAAQVKEVLTVLVSSNSSIQQYSNARISLNFTLSQWQNLIGPMLTQHIVNPTTGVSEFNLLPGPIINLTGFHTAYIIMTYEVNNATMVNETSPRVFHYVFNDNVLNFEHAVNGEVLYPNASLTIILPQGSKVLSGISPLPDLPVVGASSDYQNSTQLTWDRGETLSHFNLQFTLQQSLQDEVFGFFSQVYQTLGVFLYIIIIALIAAFIMYTYYKAKW
jgi:hypothetical protein